LKPKDVKDKGISKMALWKIKNKIKLDRKLNPKTKIIKILIQLYKESKPSKEKQYLHYFIIIRKKVNFFFVLSISL